MKHIKKIGIGLLMTILLGIKITAQTVTVINDYPVIDLSGLQNTGLVMSSAEAKQRAQEMIDASTNIGGLYIPLETMGVTGTWNSKMSGKFQVAKKDFYADLTPSGAIMSCYTHEEGDDWQTNRWRAPTKRELEMIFILHPAINVTGLVTPLAVDHMYESATKNLLQSFVVVTLTSQPILAPDGSPYPYIVSSIGWKDEVKLKLRCVRDL